MSRQKPWRADNPNAVIVARPSKWGNPFKVGSLSLYHEDGPITPEVAVSLFALHIGPMGSHEYDEYVLDAMRHELRGKDLACWCPLDQPCHADVLLEIANGADQ